MRKPKRKPIVIKGPFLSDDEVAKMIPEAQRAGEEAKWPQLSAA